LVVTNLRLRGQRRKRHEGVEDGFKFQVSGFRLMLQEIKKEPGISSLAPFSFLSS
jgi:hypothetical protein